MNKNNAITDYKASGSLILSGSLRTTAAAKTYHALLVCAAMTGWRYDDKGLMHVDVGRIHRLTRGSCANWKEYRDLLTEVRKTAELDWDQLSALSKGKFRRSGKVPLLAEAHVELDLAGEPASIAFRIPENLVDDLIRPMWYGRVNPEILFRLKSNYAFHAYLHACLTLIEKDTQQDEFWSPARPQIEWAEILGADPELPRWRFRNEIFRRTEKAITKATANTDQPIEVEFTDARCRRGLYQMRVKRIRRLPPPKQSQSERYRAAQQAQQQAQQQKAKAIDDENARLVRWVDAHPERSQILAELRARFGSPDVTYFGLCVIGYDPDA